MTAKTKATERRNPATATRCDKASVPTDTAAPSADSFNAKREGHGTKEWSDGVYNIWAGCEHGCLYCYAKANAIRYGRVKAKDWKTPKENGSFGRKGRGVKVKSPDPKRAGVVMFPTTHDTTDKNWRDGLKTIQNLLENNDVLVVSKPHLSVVKDLCAGLQDSKHKARVEFRFTIGSLDEELSKFWEPGAPLPSERIKALKYAFDAGFRTSVSIEPMLAGPQEAIAVVKAVESYVTKKTGTIWIGKMNGVSEQASTVPNFVARLRKAKHQQRDSEILALVKTLGKHPQVQWKNSIKKVIAKAAVNTKAAVKP